MLQMIAIRVAFFFFKVLVMSLPCVDSCKHLFCWALPATTTNLYEVTMCISDIHTMNIVVIQATVFAENMCNAVTPQIYETPNTLLLTDELIHRGWGSLSKFPAKFHVN